ncbi:MAG: hypothetical protein Q8R10_03755 [Pseudomonas sp.]|uniref:hypothetical protein n=1 Tax=Pseudomonas sp. TaxID=306 RepID=UPI0027367FCA|nr:hypothetical protein [Pseudomonas sp.]MDP3845522.1 hypothetical protein [Pseudomonas sp.]
MAKENAKHDDTLGGLIASTEDIEVFREHMTETLSELQGEYSSLPAVRERILKNSACAVLVPVLAKSLRAYGYSDRLDTLSDTQHAAQFYDSYIHDPRGLCLADALFLAMTFTDSHWSQTECELWRLCYRLAQLVAFYADTQRPTAISKAKAAQLARDGNTDKAKKRARQYVAANFIGSNGKPANQVTLARAVWAMLREHGRTETDAYMPPAEQDGGPTRSAIDTLKRWFAAEYTRQKNMYLKTQG